MGGIRARLFLLGGGLQYIDRKLLEEGNVE